MQTTSAVAMEAMERVLQGRIANRWLRRRLVWRGEQWKGASPITYLGTDSHVCNSRPAYIIPAFSWLRRHYTFYRLAYLDACGSC